KWLSSDPRIAPPQGRDCWSTPSIKRVLHNVVYCGMVEFNARPVGLYERAGRGERFVVPGQHERLVDDATFEAVQKRLAGATCRKSYNRHGGRDALARSLLQCTGCGGPMGLNRRTDQPLYYQCARRSTGHPCTTPSYLAHLAHTALLAEVSRLRGAPWTPQA